MSLLHYAGWSVSRRDLAAKTGLAPKQVGRYLNTLEDLGFCLRRGRLGREAMVGMPHDVPRRLRLLPFTTPELLALSFYTSLSSSVHDTTPLGHLHTACEKIATFLGQDFHPDSVLRQAFLACAKHYKLYGTPQTHAILPPSLRRSWSHRSATSRTEPSGQQRPGATGFTPIRFASTTVGSKCPAQEPQHVPILISSLLRTTFTGKEMTRPGKYRIIFYSVYISMA